MLVYNVYNVIDNGYYVMIKVFKLKKNSSLLDNIEFSNKLEKFKKEHNVIGEKYILSRGNNLVPNLYLIKYNDNI